MIRFVVKLIQSCFFFFLDICYQKVFHLLQNTGQLFGSFLFDCLKILFFLTFIKIDFEKNRNKEKKKNRYLYLFVYTINRFILFYFFAATTVIIHNLMVKNQCIFSFFFQFPLFFLFLLFFIFFLLFQFLNRFLFLFIYLFFIFSSINFHYIFL